MKCDAIHIVHVYINQLNSYYYVNDKCNEIDFILRLIYVLCIPAHISFKDQFKCVHNCLMDFLEEIGLNDCVRQQFYSISFGFESNKYFVCCINNLYLN